MAGANAGVCLPFPVSSPSLVLLLILCSLSMVTPAKPWWPWPHLGSNSSLSLGESKKYEWSPGYLELRKYMGPVLTENITVHPIWYGQWTPAQKRIIRAFLRSISPVGDTSVRWPSMEGWWRTVAMYSNHIRYNVSRTVRLRAEKKDRHYSHGRSLTRLSIQHVIRSAVTAKPRPLPVNPSGGIYLLLTSAEVAVEDFCGQVCGFHYFTSSSIVGYTLLYAWVGNAERQCPGVCCWPFAVPEGYGGRRAGAPPNGEVGVDAMVSVIAHELAELASYPILDVWRPWSEACLPREIADLCEGIYGTGGGGSYTGKLTVDERDGAAYNLNGIGGRRFLVQWIWHPELNYCYGPNALD